MKKKLFKLKKQFLKKVKEASIIDLLGIFLVVFLVGSAYFFFSRKTEYLEVTIKLLNYDGPEYTFGQNKPRALYVEKIKPGKKQIDGIGRSLSEIVDVYEYSSPTVLNDVYVTLKLRALKNKVSNQYIFDGTPLLIHEIRSFKIQDLLLTGEIVDLSAEQRTYKEFVAKLEIEPDFGAYNVSSALIEGVENYVADSLEPGMVIRDSTGRELVKIITIDKKPGTRSFVSENGFYSVEDPNRKRVFLTIKVLGEKINNGYFYRKESPLLLNEKLYLTFDNIAFLGTIFSIEESN